MAEIGKTHEPLASQYRSGEFPVASNAQQRAAADERVRAYPYRFPRDHRLMGGKFSTAENARRLLRCFYFERRLAQGLGSWTLAIPDFEVKLETGRHIFWHADAAATLRQRLSELEMNEARVDQFRDEEIDLFIEEMLSAADAPELLVGAHIVAGQALRIAYQHHIDDTDPVSDAPTSRILRRILTDYEPMLAWAEAALDAYIAGGIDESRLATWRWHLSRLLSSIGGIAGSETGTEQPTPLRCKLKPYERGVKPQRDARFDTFCNTGDYDHADGAPRFPANSYENIRLRFIRTQRDEIDAIEAFGTFLWDIRFKDFAAEHALARITWDEARHTEIGHRSLQAMGYNPFELPNRLTSSTCRGELTGENAAFAMAEINLFGEVAVLKTINHLHDTAAAANDAILSHGSDYIRADERTHVRRGRQILNVMTKLNSHDLELRTRELFTECLVSLGAIDLESMDVMNGALSREEIEHLVGE
jgi:hypothetical protein